MKQGGGIIKPSKHGYNIGDKIITLWCGQSKQKGLKDDYVSKVGDKGVITGLDGCYTEILYDNGKFGTRYESSPNKNIKIIEKAQIGISYEIY